MFYLFEILNRVKYTLISFCFAIVGCYLYYDIFFSYADLSFKLLLQGNTANKLNYYIYTHPFELYYTQLLTSFICTVYMIIPYIFWQFKDFFKTGLYKSEVVFLHSLYVKFLSFFLINYYFIYTYLAPLFLKFLENAKQTYTSSIYSVFFELKVQDFIHFIFYFNNIITSLLFFLFIIINILNHITLMKIIRHKKLFHVAAILFSTFASPPDVFSQIFLVLILFLTIEITVALKIYHYYSEQKLR